MKILFVNSFYRPEIRGGAELTIENIASGMASRGHQCAVFTTKEAGPLSSDTVGMVRVFRIGSQNIYWDHRKSNPSRLRRLVWYFNDSYNTKVQPLFKEVLRQFKPDVLSSHNLGGLSISVWDTAREANLPFIQVVHDQYLLCAAGAAFRNGKACITQCYSCRLLRRRHVSASRQASCLVGVSGYVVERLKTAGLFEGVEKRIIYNERNFPDFPARIPPQGSLVFGYIGAVTPQKGLDWLVDEFRAIASGSHLLIAGSGAPQYLANLRADASGSNITFLGHTNADDFYKMIDVLIVPSLWPDTLPGVAIEACARHIPVIASSIGGLPEIIKHGVNGLLCDPEDRHSLAHAMLQLMNDRSLIAFLGANCRTSIEQFASYDRMLDQYEKLYRTARARLNGVELLENAGN